MNIVAGLMMGTVMMAIIMNFVNMMVVTVVEKMLIHLTAQNAFAMIHCAFILLQVKIIYYINCICLCFFYIECEIPDWVGDDYCDDENNNELCSYDGGDCCGENVNTFYCIECLCNDPLFNGTTEISTGYNNTVNSRLLHIFRQHTFCAITEVLSLIHI